MRRKALLIIDLIGGGLTCAFLSLGIWSTFFHLDETGKRLTTARTQLSSTHNSLSAGEEALRQKNREREALESDIAARGALPQRSPVESDLREIARLAKAEGIELTQVTPVPGSEYPGLLELRYAISGKASFSGLLAFLGNFESSQLWADITRLEVGDRSGRPAEDGAAQSTVLVMSLFATEERDNAIVH